MAFDATFGTALVVDDALKRCIAFLEANPDQIPDTLIHRLMRAKLTHWCNRGISEGSVHMREYFDDHQDEAFLTRLLLDQYALVFGKRMVDAKIVSESVRFVKERLLAFQKKGFVRRVIATVCTDHERQTALIKRFEELAGELDALERHKVQVADALIATEKQSLAIRQQDSAGRGRVIAECATLRKETQLQIEQLLRDATVNAEAKRAAVLREVDVLEERRRALDAEIAEKRNITDELDKNPLVVEEWRRRSLSFADVIKAWMVAYSREVRGVGTPVHRSVSNDFLERQFLKDHNLAFASNGEPVSTEEYQRRWLAEEEEKKSHSLVAPKTGNPFVDSDRLSNIFNVEDWNKFYGVRPSESQLAEIPKFPWSLDLLNSPCPFNFGKRIKDTHFAFLGLPDINGVPLTVAQWIKLHPQTGQLKFYHHTNPWHQGQLYTDKITLQLRWYLLLKEIILNSTNKTPEEQLVLLPPEYEIPTTIAEVSKNLFVFKKTGIRSNGSVYAACAERTIQTSSSSASNVSCVGDFERSGLCVYDWHGRRLSNVGLGASRKLA